jgi:hypothetical protein
MSYGIVLVFEGVGAEAYWAVNSELGLDKGEGNWPAGLLAHVGGPSATGVVVSELWESKEAQEAFMASRLGAALHSAQVPPPAHIFESSPHMVKLGAESAALITA